MKDGKFSHQDLIKCIPTLSCNVSYRYQIVHSILGAFDVRIVFCHKCNRLVESADRYDEQ